MVKSISNGRAYGYAAWTVMANRSTQGLFLAYSMRGRGLSQVHGRGNRRAVVLLEEIEKSDILKVFDMWGRIRFLRLSC